jgi:hypothetical protein
MQATVANKLATLGDVTQIEMILSVSQRPRWPRQIQSVGVADVFAKTSQCTSRERLGYGTGTNAAMNLVKNTLTILKLHLSQNYF